MGTKFICLPEQEELGQEISHIKDHPLTTIHSRYFPDGESHIEIPFPEEIEGNNIYLLGSLHEPNAKTTQLILTAETLRDFGAKEVILIAPYLAYMRQDKRFSEGEGITSQYYAKLLSNHFDGLITVDPHLHRIQDLSEIYNIPTTVLHTDELIADWIKSNIKDPILIGPDKESKQWVAAIAKKAKAPFAVLTKERSGDREVVIKLPGIQEQKGKTPILIDDIVSTGNTMARTTEALIAKNMKSPVCIGIHGLFVEDAFQSLINAGAEKIITTNAVPHPSNQISIAQLIALSLPF